MLSLIKPMLHDKIELYRDDSLIACNAKPKEIEKIKQQVTKIFKSNSLEITIDAKKQILTV